MSVEEKRRKLFEKWATKVGITLNLTSSGKHYNSIYTEGAWDGFNAALDAVVIKMPEKCDVEEWSESYITFRGEGYSKELIIEAIESVGLGLKVRQ